jgi:Ca2+-binding EF-hand superfamily protein
MPREELEAMMAGVFHAADADGSGVLDRKEFCKCLKASELGLTRKEINVLLSEVDMDGNGKISYSEFMPLCFNILVERFKDDVLAEAALQNSDALTQMLLEEFEAKERGAMDPESDGIVSGKMPVSFVKAALTVLSNEMLGLSKLQITSIMSEAKVADGKIVDYMIFAPTAARMIYSMIDLSSQALRVDAIAKISESEGAQLLHALNGDTIKHVLKTAFEEADADGNGTLDPDEIADVLGALGGTVQVQCR